MARYWGPLFAGFKILKYLNKNRGGGGGGNGTVFGGTRYSGHRGRYWGVKLYLEKSRNNEKILRNV